RTCGEAALEGSLQVDGETFEWRPAAGGTLRLEPVALEGSCGTRPDMVLQPSLRDPHEDDGVLGVPKGRTGPIRLETRVVTDQRYHVAAGSVTAVVNRVLANLNAAALPYARADFHRKTLPHVFDIVVVTGTDPWPVSA